jgi:hypothetical protein
MLINKNYNLAKCILCPTNRSINEMGIKKDFKNDKKNISTRRARQLERLLTNIWIRA